MRKLQRIALGLALLATLGAHASAKSGGDERKARRTLSGTVLRVNPRAGVVEVREQVTGRIVIVRVPDGATLRTTIGTQPIVTIERLSPGMSLRDVVVE